MSGSGAPILILGEPGKCGRWLSSPWFRLWGSGQDTKKLEGQTGPCPASSQTLTLDPIPCLSPPDQCSLNNGGCSHNCSVAPGEGIVCSCPLGMELGPDNHTCQIQSYCAKHLKCSQKCDQNKFSVKCSCYEGWVLEPDGESCRSLGKPGCSPGEPAKQAWSRA